MFRQGLVFVLAIGLLVLGILTPPNPVKSGGIDVGPCGMTIRQMNPIIPGEPTKMEVYIRSSVFLDTLTFLFVSFGAARYSGQVEWRQVVNAGDTLAFPIEVVFPPNDTSGFEVTTTRKSTRFLESSFYVVTTGDSVKTFQIDPRKLLEGAGEPYTKEYLEVLKNAPPQAGMDSTTRVKFSTHQVTDWERMKMKERTSLAGDTMEVIEVNGKPYIRHPGESEFQPLPVITDRDSLMRARQEQLHEKKMRSDFDVIIDLRDSSAYAFVRDTLGWSLQPMDSAGYYRTTQSGKALLDLDSRGILHNPYPRYPRPMHYRTPEQQKVYDSIREEKRQKSLKGTKKPGISNAPQQPNDVLFFGDFESFFTDTWTSWDYNSGNGRDYWADLYWSYGPVYDGDFAAWCSTEGDMEWGDHYDNYMEAWMETIEPLYIGGHRNVVVDYWVWYETEESYDYVYTYYSSDGTSWTGPMNEMTGSSYSWTHEYYSIPDGYDSVYVGFVFCSDESNCNLTGAFVDNVLITGDPTADLPNLTYTTPLFWDGPLVPSPVPGTNDTGNLCGNAPTYIDIAVINAGDVTSDPFDVALYLDGGLLSGYFECGSYLLPWLTWYIEDHQDSISQGYHSLTMIIDTGNLITESCETDNIYEKVFYWSPPGSITVQGWATYQDMNPPSSTKDARNVKVELWDDDPSGDDILATTWTYNNGWFTFNPVSNADDPWQGRQDIYLKFYAENDAAYVNNGHGGSRITYQSAPQGEVPDGSVYLSTVNIPGPQSGPFFIVDKARDGRDKWISLQQSDPGRVEAILRNGGGSEYVSGYIVIDSSINDDLYRPDVFDGYAILHEYGHYLADSFSFFCVGSGTHSWHTESTDTLAASEAFAHFWPAVVTDNPIQKNFYNNFASYYGKNLENGEYGINGNIIGSPNDLGSDCEGTVAGVLWDLYDDDDDDYTRWKPGYPGVGQPDGIWDSLDNGISNILACLTQRNTGAGHHPLNIYEFWNVWFQSPTLDNNQKLWGVYREHELEMDVVYPNGSVVINNGDSITSSLIVGLTLSATDTLSGMAPPLAKMQISNNNNVWTNWEPYATAKANWDLSTYGGDTTRTTKTVYVRYKDAASLQSPSYTDGIIYRDYLCGDANGDKSIGIGDAVYIITWIFRGGPEPSPIYAADANCDGATNIGDAVRIVNYIFRQGPEPCCP